MGSITENLHRVKSLIPQGVELVAVSKFHPGESILEAYNAGQRLFAESRAAELTGKKQSLPADIRWHFIGHLQSNKVKQVVASADVIESIDSEKILKLVDREAERAGRQIDLLMQVQVAMEETKFGFAPDDLLQLLSPALIDSLKATRIAGIMGMASNTDDTSRIAADFASLKCLFDTLASGVMKDRAEFRLLSMGMSDDFPIAVDHGSNMVRIGTDIFGPREY